MQRTPVGVRQYERPMETFPP